MMPGLRTMLCLAGEQPMPNAIAARQLGARDLLVLHTDDPVRSAGPAGRLADWWNRSRQGSARTLGLGSDVDYPLLVNEITAALGSAAGAEWVVNLTGGTKPMSLAALTVARELGCAAVYVDTLGDRLLWFEGGGAAEPLTATFRVDEVLALYGHPTASTAELDPADREAALALSRNRRLTHELAEASRQAGGTPGVSKLLRLDDQEARALVAHGVLTEARPEGLGRYTVTLAEPVRKLAEGGWLEVMASVALKRAGAFDVATNVVRRQVANEADVIATFGPRVVVVECKSGDRDEAEDALLAKLADRTRALGGSLALGIFVWSPPPTLNPQSLRDRVASYAERAYSKHLRFFHGENPDQLAERVKAWLGLA